MRLIDRPLLRSLSGERLSIRNPNVRLVYLDEAGMSQPGQEPIVVVAGVIVNGDQDWRLLESHLLSLQRKYLPEEDSRGFIFHATEIFHGTKYFDRERWPLVERRKILSDLVKIPNRFHLPVVYIGVNKAAVSERHRQLPPKANIAAIAYSQAFIEVVKDVDGWMGANAPAEVAMLIAEDINKIKMSIKWLHAGYTDLTIEDEDVFRTRNIIDTVSFAAKNESILLQIADVCAFVIKRKLMKRPDVDEFWDELKPAVVSPWGNSAQRTFRFVPIHIPASHTNLLRRVSDDVPA